MNRFLLSNLWPDEAQSDLQSNASVPETESIAGEFHSCISAEILIAGENQEPTKPTMLSELRDISFSTQVGQDDELSQNAEVNNPNNNYIELARAKTERILAENAHLHQDIMTLGIENSKLKHELNEKSAIDERRIKEIVKGLERNVAVKLRKEIRELQANNSAMEKEYELKLNDAVDVARHKFEAEQNSLSAKLSNAFIEIARLEKDLDESRVQSESMNESLLSARNKENELKKKLQLELKVLTETEEHDKQTIAKLTKVCQDSKSQIGLQTRKANDYEEKQKNLEAEVLELKKKAVTAERTKGIELKKLSDKLASLESENQNLKRDWAKSSEAAKISLAKSNSKISEIESLRLTERQASNHLSKQLEESKTSEIVTRTDLESSTGTQGSINCVQRT